MENSREIVYYHYRFSEDPYYLWDHGYGKYVPEAGNFKDDEWKGRYNFLEFCDGKSRTLINNKILLQTNYGDVYHILLDELVSKKDQYPFLDMLYNAYIEKSLIYQRIPQRIKNIESNL